jgi:hypothetical protein
MKAIYGSLLVLAIILLGCTNHTANKGSTESNIVKNTSEVQPPNSQQNPTDAVSPGEGVVGYWKLALEAYDDNDNRQLDAEERSKGFSNRYSFRFNADKSCRIMDMFKGHYEIEEKNGKKLLNVYRDKVAGEEESDPPPDIYLVTSMSNDEMVLLETLGNHTFWVFKRS